MKHIDPQNITKFDRTLPELERFLIFCICVAGRNSKMVADKLNNWWIMDMSPPSKILSVLTKEDIAEELLDVKMGQYGRISNALYIIADFGAYLHHCTLKDLLEIKGIGPKTARFFLLHSRPNQRLACLDTHILRYMRENGIAQTPKSTPSGKKYLQLEQKWLEYCDSQGKSSAEMDLEIWKKGASK